MSDIIKDLECLNVGDDQWVYECAQRAIDEIKRLRESEANLREVLKNYACNCRPNACWGEDDRCVCGNAARAALAEKGEK